METLNSAEPLLLQQATVISDEATAVSSYSADSSYCHVESTTPDEIFYEYDVEAEVYGATGVYAAPSYYQCTDESCSMLQYGTAFVDNSAAGYVGTGHSFSKRSFHKRFFTLQKTGLKRFFVYRRFNYLINLSQFYLLTGWLTPRLHEEAGLTNARRTDLMSWLYRRLNSVILQKYTISACSAISSNQFHRLILRLQDEAGSTSWLVELARPVNMKLAQRDGSIFARCLFDVCSMSARCVLDVCLMFASCRLCFMHALYLLDVCSTFALCLLDRVNGVWILLTMAQASTLNSTFQTVGSQRHQLAGQLRLWGQWHNAVMLRGQWRSVVTCRRWLWRPLVAARVRRPFSDRWLLSSGNGNQRRHSGWPPTSASDDECVASTRRLTDYAGPR